MKKIVILSFITLIALVMGCKQQTKESAEADLQAFIDKYLKVVEPLSREANNAYFEASVSGIDSLYKKYEKLSIELSKVYTNKEDFKKLDELKKSNLVDDSILHRELDILWRAYLGSQVNEKILEEIIMAQTAIEQKFSKFRAVVGKDSLSDNQIENVLKTSTKSEEVKNAWLAHKEIGPLVAEDVKKVVKLRNQMAVEAGFKNYHEMSLQLSEQDPQQIEKLFDELDNLTRSAFEKQKSEIDDYLVKKFGLKSKDELMPWHYQNRFFQEAPKIYTVNLDGYYEKQNIEELTKKFYTSIGLSVDQILAKSDLYEKKDKYQHAYCTDIDRNGDVRVVCNIKSNTNWMETMLHENGHAAYFYYTNRQLPYLLREPAHTFTTEAIAMMMGRFATNPQWLKSIVGIKDDEAKKISDDCFKVLRLQELVFSRWAQVMYRFEKNMYANPDQDLNKLWWDIVERYQMLKRPADRNMPDWATKIHIATVPCYYHNYMLGDLLASQFYTYICTNIIKTNDLHNVDFSNNPAIGNYLKDRIFYPANRWYWDEMIKYATGDNLSAKYYAKQFVE